MDENKELDSFIRKSTRELGLEKPPINFTDSIISKIEAEQHKNTAYSYTPIFSTRQWVAITAVIMSVFALAIFGNLNHETTAIAQLVDKILVLPELPVFAFSSTFTYAFLGVGIFVWIQIFLLKQQFQKVA